MGAANRGAMWRRGVDGQIGRSILSGSLSWVRPGGLTLCESPNCREMQLFTSTSKSLPTVSTLSTFRASRNKPSKLEAGRRLAAAGTAPGALHPLDCPCAHTRCAWGAVDHGNRPRRPAGSEGDGRWRPGLAIGQGFGCWCRFSISGSIQRSPARRKPRPCRCRREHPAFDAQHGARLQCRPRATAGLVQRQPDLNPSATCSCRGVKNCGDRAPPFRSDKGNDASWTSGIGRGHARRPR